MSWVRVFYMLCLALHLTFMQTPSIGFAQAKSSYKYRALVIGNSAYKPDKLSGPENDANDMAKALKEIGFTVINATAMINLNRSQMLEQIEHFMLGVDKNTISVIYYSGHGVEDSNTNYLVPIDSTLKNYADIDTQLVSLDGILKRFAQREARTRIIILDACRDLPSALKYTKSFGEKGGLSAVKDLSPGTSIVYATSPNKVAIGATKFQRNSVFTSALLEAMETRPSTFLELLVTAAKLTYKNTAEKQSPWLSGELQMAAFQLYGAGQNVSVNPLAQPSIKKIDPNPKKSDLTLSCSEVSEQIVENGVTTWRIKCL